MSLCIYDVLTIYLLNVCTYRVGRNIYTLVYCTHQKNEGLSRLQCMCIKQYAIPIRDDDCRRAPTCKACARVVTSRITAKPLHAFIHQLVCMHARHHVTTATGQHQRSVYVRAVTCFTRPRAVTMVQHNQVTPHPQRKDNIT